MPTPRGTGALGASGMPDITFGKKDIDPVVDKTVQALAGKMGIKAADLPPEITKAVRSAAEAAMKARAKVVIQRDVDLAVKSTMLQGMKPLDLLDARVIAAKDGIGHIAQDKNVDAVLADTATLLRKKYTALVKAGFNEQQAFDLVLAEVQGRASRNR